MKQLIPFISLLLIPFALLAGGQPVPVSIPIDQDSRDWVKVREDDINGQGIVEFMLEDQDRTNWTEVVTLQYFWSDTLNPKELFNMFIGDLEQQVGSDKITKTILEEKHRDIMAEWTIDGTSNDQKEIIRIFGDGKVVVILRYTVKPERASEKNIQTWKEIIRQASLQN